MKDKDNQENSQIYEMGYHLLPTVPEDGLELTVSKIKSALVEAGALVISEDFPRTKQLSYPISKSSGAESKKYSKAYFGWIKFHATPDGISAVRKIMKENPEILRFLIAKTVKESTVHYSRPVVAPVEKVGVTEEVAEPVKEMSEEEIDKSIEELVIN